MAPCIPKKYTAGQNPVTKFEGAFVVTKMDPPEGRCFLFHTVINVNHHRVKALEKSGKKPPKHFHPNQYEYFKVISGQLTVEINDVEHILTPEDGEVTLEPGPHHRLWGTPGQKDDKVVFLISASTNARSYQLDQAFFENWYGYQEDMMMRGTAPDLIQVCCMFEAGDSYLSPPWWVPFRHFFGYWLTVILGYYIGSLLGYQPFFPEWTTDWDAACDKMASSLLQKKFAIRELQDVVKKNFDANGDPLPAKKLL
ncbi:hypothetical protein TWF569_011640 [Orbilia oligospora]|uniref:Cupin type-2 domain-containing protein n=1 Tax=Orbilia oligospora TaxID=2813651 RepID=A0A4Z0Y713_ORBOL|nr:hypothetical protein TWF102_007179 [Orbilia oligospora]KAF3102875.1 hypothetical protein TWF103_007576 [Orbilia oligospora]KAF3113075.1 hypothetical protein TWF706_010077 [Orbilia oligospora]KAF3120069.1 hypothetical protein TWF703_002911 [Orbilia oligospora]KAF3127033.1 hypothetical protein TWF594_000807 [Orbilia oligospora]